MTLITIDLNLVFRVLKIHNTLHWLSKIQHSYRSPTIYLTLDIDAKKVIVFSSPSNHKCKYRIERVYILNYQCRIEVLQMFQAQLPLGTEVLLANQHVFALHCTMRMNSCEFQYFFTIQRVISLWPGPQNFAKCEMLSFQHDVVKVSH